MSLTTEALAKSVGYQFKDPRLLDSAVTHRSAGSGNNERLEFLGDAVLGQVVAEQLYHSFPKADEGQLSRLRASLGKRFALDQAGAKRSPTLLAAWTWVIICALVRVNSGAVDSGVTRYWRMPLKRYSVRY